MRWYLMPSTSARRLQRLMASAASSMNCCGLRLKSSSRPLSDQMRRMLRRVSWVGPADRSAGRAVRCRLRRARRSRRRRVSVASTPALPMAMSALRHCRRVLVIGGRVLRAPRMQLVDQLLVVELHAVGGLVLDAVPQRLELALCSTACRVCTCRRSSAFLISSRPASLRRISRDLRSWASNGSGTVSVPSFSALLQRVLHLALGVDVALRPSGAPRAPSTARSPAARSGRPRPSTAMAANWCVSTMPKRMPVSSSISFCRFSANCS